MDYILLTRIQFALTACFHIVFPALLIGLSAWLLYLNIRCIRPGTYKNIPNSVHFGRIYDYWVRWFFLVFCMAVFSGVLLSLQLDTSAGGLYREAGNVLGGIRKAELFVGLIFEGGFIGPMVFGRQKLSPRAHFISTSIVTLGIYLGVCLILIRNSWMQTPSGYIFQNNVMMLDNLYEVIFNPSFLFRLLHMVLAGWISTACFIAGVSAFRLKKLNEAEASGNIRLCVKVILVTSVLQLVSGDLHGLNIKKYQPAKLAAIEAVWHTGKQVPFTLFAIPDATTERNNFAIEVPYLASVLLTHSPEGQIQGLSDFPVQHRPPVLPVFYAFRVMLALGFLILSLGIWGCYSLWKSSHFSSRFLTCAVYLTPAGLIATISGWCVAEVGRQPWTIYGLLKTSHAVKNYGSNETLISLAAFCLISVFLGSVFIYFSRRLLTSSSISLQNMTESCLICAKASQA
ncbi:hypothetical protein BTA51_29410 [Hahella sp. CCB-MM4]|uniref:cytochrome ubiquinol oxidase subunit I n=1 Tax=Hahella sp. (strain CCB-MM4) TaxID=1926491 RepID=UPI000B9BB377|nr:cytochrome ubiquinol oxidase subunit I [Hahella sp. CCB-MM4]OZG69744.1 hypothetical protein BTA51_29410 [Hahella sp. CCB-MM4]